MLDGLQTDKKNLQGMLEEMYDKIKFIHSKYEIDPVTGMIIGEKFPNVLENDEIVQVFNKTEIVQGFNKTDESKENFGNTFLETISPISIVILIFISVLLVILFIVLMVMAYFSCCYNDCSGCNKFKDWFLTKYYFSCCYNDCSCCNKFKVWFLTKYNALKNLEISCKRKQPEIDTENERKVLENIFVGSGLKFENRLPSKFEIETEKYKCPIESTAERFQALEQRAGIFSLPRLTSKTTSVPNLVLKYENEEFKYFETRKREVEPPLHARSLPRPRSCLEPLYENLYENAQVVDGRVRPKSTLFTIQESSFENVEMETFPSTRSSVRMGASSLTWRFVRETAV